MVEYRSLCSLLFLALLVSCTSGESPYRFYDWNVTYGDIYPLGVKQKVTYFIYIYIYLVSWLRNEWLLIIWVFNSNAGDFNKWAISRASHWFSDQWQLDYQCLQWLGRTFSHFLVSVFLLFLFFFNTFFFSGFLLLILYWVLFFFIHIICIMEFSSDPSVDQTTTLKCTNQIL